MRSNEPTLMWARTDLTGNIWEDSASFTKPLAESWPDFDGEDLTPGQKEKRFGKAKLYRIIYEPVGEKESAEYLERENKFLEERRIARGIK